MESIHEKSTNQEMLSVDGGFGAYSGAVPKLPMQINKASSSIPLRGGRQNLMNDFSHKESQNPAMKKTETGGA